MSEKKALPQGWAVTTLSRCSTRITDGTHLPPKFEDDGIPFVFVKHIAPITLATQKVMDLHPSSY